MNSSQSRLSIGPYETCVICWPCNADRLASWGWLRPPVADSHFSSGAQVAKRRRGNDRVSGLPGGPPLRKPGSTPSQVRPPMVPTRVENANRSPHLPRSLGRHQLASLPLPYVRSHRAPAATQTHLRPPTSRSDLGQFARRARRQQIQTRRKCSAAVPASCRTCPESPDPVPNSRDGSHAQRVISLATTPTC